MIHRESRDRLAVALRHYVSGHLSNDELDEVEVECRDRGAVAVKGMAWGPYDDTRHHHVGDYPIPRGSQARRTVARWIAFLYSDAEYIWPECDLMRIVNWPMNLLTFGWWERMKRRRWEEFLEAGDFSVWPFCRREELEDLLRNPKLLGGRGRPTRG